MQWYWTWGGECFGYRLNESLITYRGIEAGRFDGDEVYASDGRYLGEIKSDDRLITDRGKRNKRRSIFSPIHCGSYARYCNYAGYGMHAGYEDFPSPEVFG